MIGVIELQFGKPRVTRSHTSFNGSMLNNRIVNECSDWYLRTDASIEHFGYSFEKLRFNVCHADLTRIVGANTESSLSLEGSASGSSWILGESSAVISFTYDYADPSVFKAAESTSTFALEGTASPSVDHFAKCQVEPVGVHSYADSTVYGQVSHTLDARPWWGTSRPFAEVSYGDKDQCVIKICTKSKVNATLDSGVIDFSEESESVTVYLREKPTTEKMLRLDVSGQVVASVLIKP